MSDGVVWTGTMARQLRVDLGLTRKEFALACGIPVASISTLERRGELNPPLQYLYRDVDRETAELRKQMVVLRNTIRKVLSKK